MKDPVMFKTIAGVDYIGVIGSEDSEVYNIEKLFAIVPNQNQNGETNIQFGAVVHPALGKVSSTTHGSMNITLRKSSVLFIYEPNEQLGEAYLQATSGIQIVKKMPGNM